MNGFWREFMKGDASQVHTPYAAMAIAFLLATPIVVLSLAVVINHIFVHGRPLDGPTVQLLLGLLGAATGGVISAGATMFSKTTLTSITGMNLPGRGPGGECKPPPAKPAPPEV